MLQRCYTLSPRARLEVSLHGAAPTYRLHCSHPLQTHAVNETAWRLLGALRPGVPLDALASGIGADTLAFLEALVRSGALRAEYRLAPQADAGGASAVDVVIPAYADAAGVTRCLGALAVQQAPGVRMRVTVVDDASAAPLQARVTVPAGLPVRWLRLPRNVGPASARNAGAATPWPEDPDRSHWLAFVDADCVPQPGWLAALAALLEDPHVAAAGGAVRGLSRAGLLARYEDACSSLYLGPRAGAVGEPDGALSYLPSCNLAVWRAAFDAVGGFRPGWRFGEDVDLCWRLHGAGYGLFYHPDAEVAHAHRTRWGAFLQRRRAYARSEAPLRQHHPARFRPLWLPAPALLLAGLAAALATGVALWLLSVVAAVGWLVAGPLIRVAGRGAGRGAEGGAGHRTAGVSRWPVSLRLAAGVRQAAAHLLLQARQLNRLAMVLWLPVPVLIPPLWPLVAGVLVTGALAEWLARRPALGVGTWCVGYLAECLAYSLGRTEGLLAARLPGARPAPDEE